MILITGGAGFIGSNLVAALTQERRRVVVCDKVGSDGKWLNISKCPIEDFVDPDELIGFLRGNTASEITSIVHLGAISSTTEQDVDKLIHYNFRCSKILWQVSAETGVPFFYASSAATYGDGQEGFDDQGSLSFLSKLRPRNPYAWSKHLFDLWVATQVEQGNLVPPQWAGLKFFNVYGPNEYHKGHQASVIFHFFNQLSESGLIRLFESHKTGIDNGCQKRDFVWVADCVDVIRWLFENSAVSGLFNVGSGQARTFLDVAGAVFRSTNFRKNIEFIPTPNEIRESYQYFTQANILKLRSAGYPKEFTSLEDGVQKYVAEYLSNNNPFL